MNSLSRFAVVMLVGIMFVGGGCHPAVESEIDQLSIRRGDGQTGKPGDIVEEAIIVELLGPRRAGLLGGKGRRRPVPDAEVIFQPVDPETGLTVLDADRVLTDSGGYARARVKLGSSFGDQYLHVYVADAPHVSATLRLVSGIVKDGDMQEAIAGDRISRPLRVMLTGADHQPLAGVPVYFKLIESPGDGQVEQIDELTDDQGVAQAFVHTDPSATGKYKILAEVVDPGRGISLRGIPFTIMAIDRMGLILGVLGGLGIFIFGMKLMSGGLRQVAGNRLKSFLHFCTHNRVMAVIAGATATGLIQSSTACSVMVVGFVNAGLISLRQAIGVLFGANIGTTITAQMISLNIQELALPAIIIGVIVYMLARRSKGRSIAHTILGFGFLFLGMTMMSQQLKGISEFPTFISFFQLFDCTPAAGGKMPILPVLGAIGIGTAMTMLVQSSSATIGLTIALAVSGLINFYTAVPLILGDNIGTTITAMLASIGTNRPARQSAVAHMIFNLLGATYMVLLFYVHVRGVPLFLYISDAVTSGDVFAEMPENIARHIASAHTLFNVFNVLLFLPLVPAIAWLCNRIVPCHPEKLKTVPLEPHLLDTPAIAIDQSINSMLKMTETAVELTKDCVKQLHESRIREGESLRRREELIDQMQHDTIHYVTELTRRYLTESQADIIPLLVHCVNDAERVGDHAMNILELAELRADQKTEFSQAAWSEIDHICELLRRQAILVVNSFERNGEDTVAAALKLEGEINQLAIDAEQNHIKRLENEVCSVKSGILYTEIIGDLERIGDRLANIAERAAGILHLRTV